jgi:alanine-synthesizing transaminase
VEIDADREAIVTIGSKEGLAHLMLATLDRGDTVLVPDPSYPIHIYGAVIAGADIRSVPLVDGVDFFAELERAIRGSYPKPKMMVLGFPSNPTAQCVELDFFERVIALAKKHDILVVHDLAYADIVFDGWKAPSSCRCPARRTSRSSSSRSARATTWPAGASASWSATRPGERAGAHQELPRLRHFTPMQVAAIAALEGDQQCVIDIARLTRSAATCWPRACARPAGRSETPKASMYIWARIPEPYRALGSLEFAKQLLAKAKVSVSPGIGFGDHGDDHVRFALIENESRIRQAVRGIKAMFAGQTKGGPTHVATGHCCQRTGLNRSVKPRAGWRVGRGPALARIGVSLVVVRNGYPGLAGRT